MNTRTLTTGLALSASLLLAPSVLAVNTWNSGYGGAGVGGVNYSPTHLGGGGDNYNLPPDSSLGGGTGEVYYSPGAPPYSFRVDPNENDDLGSQRNTSLIMVLTLRFIPGLNRFGSALR